jgi:hypothetical protein
LFSDYNNDPFRVPSFYKLGIDAVFSDFTDTAVKARNILKKRLPIDSLFFEDYFSAASFIFLPAASIFSAPFSRDSPFLLWLSPLRHQL